MPTNTMLSELLDVYGSTECIHMALLTHAGSGGAPEPEQLRIYADKLNFAAEALEALIELLQKA